MSIDAMKQAIENATQVITFEGAQYYLMTPEDRDAAMEAIEEAERQEPVVVIRTWHKGMDQHGELLNWLDAIEDVPDGEHNLYTTPQPAIPDGMVLVKKSAAHFAAQYMMGAIANGADVEVVGKRLLAAAPKPGDKE